MALRLARAALCAAESLGPGGQFIATFRDYTAPLAGDARFIPVRADENRILTCFLEYGDDHVDVHDLLYERQGSVWQFKVSGYRKLRLPPAWVGGALDDAGFSVRTEPGASSCSEMVFTAFRQPCLPSNEVGPLALRAM